MGTGYTRNDVSNNIANGNVINASDLDGEFDAIVDAFNATTGHTHDGTSTEGAAITVIGPVQDFVASATAFSPKATGTYDLGTTTLRYDVAYLNNINLNGTAITSTAAEINILDGVTATTTEINKLAGVTATTAEINYIDGVTSAIQTQLDNKQPLDVDLTTIAGLVNTDGQFIVGSATGWVAESGGTARTSLGLGSIATQDADAVSITGGSVTGITDLTVADGGTGASTAAGARTNLGLVIGTDVQAEDAGLTSIAGLTTVENQMIYTTGADTYATTGLTAQGRALLDDADAATQRGTLGLGSLSTSNATLGNLATNNSISLTNEVTGTIAEASLPNNIGKNAGTGININSTTGAINTNITQNNTTGNLNAVNLSTSTVTASNEVGILSDAGTDVTLSVANEALFSLNANNTNRVAALTFNGNTPGSGNLRNSNVVLGNLASSNETVGTGNLRNLNSVNLANNVSGTLDRDSFEGYNSGTGITVNNSTGAIASNVTAGDKEIINDFGSFTRVNTSGTSVTISGGNGSGRMVIAGMTLGRSDNTNYRMHVTGNNAGSRMFSTNGGNTRTATSTQLYYQGTMSGFSNDYRVTNSGSGQQVMWADIYFFIPSGANLVFQTSGSNTNPSMGGFYWYRES